MRSACGELSGDAVSLWSLAELSQSIWKREEEVPEEGREEEEKKKGQNKTVRNKHKGKGRMKRSGGSEG